MRQVLWHPLSHDQSHKVHSLCSVVRWLPLVLCPEGISLEPPTLKLLYTQHDMAPRQLSFHMLMLGEPAASTS